MARTMRVVWVGRRDLVPSDADVVVASPEVAPALSRALTRATRRARLVVEGAVPVERLAGRVGRIEASGPIAAFAVQRALQLGAEVVVAPDAVPGAAVQGGAAWYHAWKPQQHDAWAGGLLAGRCAAVCAPPVSIAVDRDGSFVLAPAERATVVEELLLGTGGDGHDSPEVQARLESLWVQGAGADRVRIWGTVGLLSDVPADDARVHLDGQVHPAPAPPRPPGRPLVDEESLGTETTMSFPPESGSRVEVPLGRLVHAGVRTHGNGLVLALWTRDATHWDWLDDTVDHARIRAWVGDGRPFVRIGLPNLSAVRILLAAPADDLADRALADVVEVDQALLRGAGT